MRLMNKRLRHAILAGALIITCLLIWWTRVYAPLKERGGVLEMDLLRVSLKEKQLGKKVKNLNNTLKAEKKENVRLERITRVIGKTGTLEENNAIVQAAVQKFLESHEIPLKTYKQISPGRWRGYPMGRLEFRLTTDIQGIADLLEFLEKLKGMVRVERLQINNRRRKARKLEVSLRLGTLFVSDLVKKGKS